MPVFFSRAIISCRKQSTKVQTHFKSTIDVARPRETKEAVDNVMEETGVLSSSSTMMAFSSIPARPG